MSVDVVTSIEIARPRAEVATYAGDPSNAPEWYVNIASVEWHGEKDVRLGAKMDFVASFLGRRLAYTYEIVELDPGHRLVMRTQEGPFPMETTYEWADAAEGSTRMTLRNRGVPTGFGRIAAPLMQAAVRRANAKDLAELKRLLEGAQ